MRARAAASTILLVGVCSSSIGVIASACSAFSSTPPASTVDGGGDGSSSSDAVSDTTSTNDSGDASVAPVSCAATHSLCDDFEEVTLQWSPRWTSYAEQSGATIRRSNTTPNLSSSGTQYLDVTLPTSPSEAYVQKTIAGLSHVTGAHCQFQMRLDQTDGDRIDIITVALGANTSYEYDFTFQVVGVGPTFVAWLDDNDNTSSPTTISLGTWTSVDIVIVLNSSATVKVGGVTLPASAGGTESFTSGSATISFGGRRAESSSPSPAHVLLDDVACDLTF